MGSLLFGSYDGWTALAAGEARGPLLEKVRDPFLEVLGAEALPHLLLRHRGGLGETLELRLPELALDDAHRAGRDEVGELTRVAEHARHERRGGQHLGHQAHAERVVRVDLC